VVRLHPWAQLKLNNSEKMKKTKEEIAAWLLENCQESNGNINISFLDFGDFKGNLLMGGMKLKRDIFQSGHKNGGDIFQSSHKNGGDINQHSHQNKGDIGQYWHENEGKVIN
tara:strand:+ start:140 stop:475 length:336 start_codon:yes stop_codon:yes gene_type:complete